MSHLDSGARPVVVPLQHSLLWKCHRTSLLLSPNRTPLPLYLQLKLAPRCRQSAHITVAQRSQRQCRRSYVNRMLHPKEQEIQPAQPQQCVRGDCVCAASLSFLELLLHFLHSGQVRRQCRLSAPISRLPRSRRLQLGALISL